jgi:dTDP-4-dehydrorhamnose reductase
MTIFVTGASGLVGSAFARAAKRRGHQVVGVVGSYLGELEGVAKRVRLDLTDEAATTASVLEVFPDAIVNCAAVSVPEQCDVNPARAETLNVALPARLARLAHHVNARLVHLSSEQVFDGASDRPYAVEAPVAPINLYGRQKVASEAEVTANAGALAVTLRAPLLMGNSAAGQRSLHERLFADWAAGRTPTLFTDEIRQTCTAENLAEVMVELCERRDVHGVQHWAGAEPISRHALGLRVRERFKLNERQAPLGAVTRAQKPELAGRRQASLKLVIAPLAAKLKTRAQTIAEQLDELQVPAPFRGWYFSQA